MPAHYPYLLDPTEYPDYTRRPVRVPTWKTFENTTQFTTLRGFTIKDDLLVDWRDTLDLHTERHKLGRVVWPTFQTIFPSNFPELVAEIKKRGLYLFDIWGHVPGSSTEGFWSHVMPPPGMVKFLERELGDRFLGFDNGEQDGRYIGGYAPQQCPSRRDRFRQYLNFQRHFERLCDDLGNHLSALVSICFGHYFLKEGNHVLLGAETAQALPSSQIYYAFIRGACKQYGVHWFGNASVFNRWGFKSYGPPGSAEGYPCGPTKGSSLNLLKRLLYTHYLYNCVAIGFESAWFAPDNELSPLGRIQEAAVRFVEENGQPGVMHTPVALLLDHFAGWAVPRHLYTGSVYQVWGGMPYEAGDYLTHGVLSTLYPGYEGASYFRDERGFLSPTPFGDMADCLLSDAPSWVLGQYGLIVAAGRLSGGIELRDKLEEFVTNGGHLIITADNARRLWAGLSIGRERDFPAESAVEWSDGTQTIETMPFTLRVLGEAPANMEVRATCEGIPAVVEMPLGAGKVTLLLSPFGLNEGAKVSGPIANDAETPLACPFGLLDHVGRVLAQAFSTQQLFSVGDGLGFVTCRKTDGEYLLGVHNNGVSSLPLNIVSHCGEVEGISEVSVDQSEKGAEGYWPEGMEDTDPGVSNEATIAGGDIRLFSVRLRESELRLLKRAKPPRRVSDRILSLRDLADLKEAILRWPTFFQHFDGVKLDWTYLRNRDRKHLTREKAWLKRQKLRVVVDFSSGLNFYPTLTLLDTLAFRYEESVEQIDDVLAKMKVLGARDAVFSLHRKPENQCDEGRADDRFLAGVRDLCRRAGKRKVRLHLQHHPRKWHGTASRTLQFIKEVGEEGDGVLHFALNTAHAAMTKESPEEILEAAGDRLGLALVCAPSRDLLGQEYDAHAPLYESGTDVAPVLGAKCPLVFDADYRDWNEVYRDCAFLDGRSAGS